MTRPNAAISFTSTVRGAVRARLARLAPVMVAAIGIGAGVTLGALVAASERLAARLDHPLRSRYLQAEQATRARTGTSGA